MAHPYERILGVSDGGKGAEVKDEGELSFLQWQGEGSKSRVLNIWAGVARSQVPASEIQALHQAGQSTCHLTQYHFISCLQCGNVFEA